uniref:TRPM SLOG domain-containing protein n=1 Tax=Acrobeloides nanus TaxID=290746 RepID=A0A914C0U7_9BILA
MLQCKPSKLFLSKKISAPKVPVVICEDSGRSSDLLSAAYKYVGENKMVSNTIFQQLLMLTKEIFNLDNDSIQSLLKNILSIVTHKNLITIYRNGNQHHLDYYIAKALYKERNLTPYEQLMLALAWNRVDIAQNEIFTSEIELSKCDLYDVMMETLIQNKVDFVKLLLEKGVNMQKFLTIKRLEDLYNSDHGNTHMLFNMIKDLVRVQKEDHHSLIEIGLVVEKLIGHGFKFRYTTNEFRKRYESYKSGIKENSVKHIGLYKTHSETNINNLPLDKPIIHKFSVHLASKLTKKSQTRINMNHDKELNDEENGIFPYPFSDLFIWAILTQRHEMAICMWEHGEEALAKALIGMRLYKCLAIFANKVENKICVDSEELKKFSENFHNRALELLDLCFKHDVTNTLQLLTYELSYLGNETCISLAVLCNSKAFLAHPCCQTLLADLWNGGLQIRSHINLKVVLCLLFPPFIFLLDFKSKEELKLQPQTLNEHTDLNNEDTASEHSSEYDSSADKTSKIGLHSEIKKPNELQHAASSAIVSKKYRETNGF